MTSCTDPLGLNNKRLFKDLKSSLPKVTRDSRNTLEIRDDILYVWHAEKCCILTLNVTAVRGKNEDIPYQVSDISHSDFFYARFTIKLRTNMMWLESR
ncbi:hypothetical protein TSAR_010337 [Trichomalopsis sarcophagae]|uniref:Uncharacterized protein n=1 Tax=Trichomalopsis sarcophagae TaxID=543379 RepID=A0A232FBT6_9HYME|nr:hypothetical protein TSAR_010337 [Trichomalopsis sarcophagae]